MKFKPLLLSNFCCEFVAEFCGIEISCIKTIIITIYRSCVGDFGIFLVKLEAFLQSISNQYNKLVLIGDFNIHFKITSGNLNELVCLLGSFGLTVTISENTIRVTARSASCIDNILTNPEEDGYEVGVVDPCLSDHFGQFIKIYGNNDIPENILRKRFTNHGLNKLRINLLDTEWSIFNNGSYSANYLSELLVNNFSMLINRIFSVKKM